VLGVVWSEAFDGVAVQLAALLLLLNVAFVVAVYGRRIHAAVQRRREARVRARLGPVVTALGADPSADDRTTLIQAVRSLDRRSRPAAAALLLERLAGADDADRAAVRSLLRESGAIEVALRSTEAPQAWRRALACAALGAAREPDALPALLARLDDRNGHVREAAVEALGLIRAAGAEPALRRLFLMETQVRPGIVYAALVRLGTAAAPAFEEGLGSASPAVRAASCAGLAQITPDQASAWLAAALADTEPRVRATAAEALGRIGGEDAPDALLVAAADPADAVRSAAVAALGAYDDPRAVGAAVAGVQDARREIALRAGETLVRLSGKRRAGPLATAQAEAHPSWALETARVLAGIGAL